MKVHENIAVLLATYNSAPYLNEQLESLVSQTDKNWSLYIRDDGSSDETLGIIHKYVRNNTNIHLLEDCKKNRGAMHSFMYLLSQVKSHYYMFCDHDDVWLDSKIELSRKAIMEIEEANPNIPVVVHSDLLIVDANLKVKHESFWRYSKINPDILENKDYLQVFNCVTGCTMIFNSMAKDVSFPYPPNAPMHDWWIAMCVIKGGIIRHLNTPTIMYRQHCSNEVGARDINRKYFWKKIVAWSNTLAGHRQHISFLKSVNGLSTLKYYYYKIKYTTLRNIKLYEV